MSLSRSAFRNFVNEVSLVYIGQEIYDYVNRLGSYENSDSDSSDSSNAEEDEVDEEIFIRKMLDIINQLELQPVEISRPYRTPGVTRDHVNSVTVDNFHQKYPEGYVRAILRFEKVHIIELVTVLQLPNVIMCSGRNIPAFEALVIFLRRLAYPGRYVDLMVELDRSPQTLAFIFNTMALLIHEKFGNLVRSLEHPLFVNRERQEEYARAIFQKGCPFPNCTHFGDGSCIVVCRPSVFQERFYCGHHGHHCLKIILIQLPNGISFAFGPFGGASHDSSAAQEMELDQYLRTRLSYNDGTQFLGMYDKGFQASDVMMTPARNPRANRDPDLAAFNLAFSRVRITNEQGIGKVKNLWAFIDYHKKLKVLLSPVAVYVFDAVLLTNLHAIYYGNQVASYFNLPVPTLQEYINL